jgi:energy-coupling factor transporter ATP-binding protein EcfA2
MELIEIAVANYRSIGSNPIPLDLTHKCTILVGPNNAGKSTLLRAIDRALTEFRRFHLTGYKPTLLSELDYHGRSLTNAPAFVLTFKSTPSEDWAANAGLETVSFTLKWGMRGLGVEDASFAHLTDLAKVNALAANFLNVRFGAGTPLDLYRPKLLELAPRLFEMAARDLPETALIPEFRRIRDGENYALDGTRLVERLAELQSPEIGQDDDSKKFLAIQQFARELLALPDARLDVSHRTKQLTVESAGLRLPLEHYGTGVHELIIMLTAVIAAGRKIVLVEEPEIHLHPYLQRRFMEFISSSDAKHVVLSTHSSALVNSAERLKDVTIVQLKQKDNATTSQLLVSGALLAGAFKDLGLQPSDFVLANGIVWVEGPSDRVYLNRWLELLAPELQEGRDFIVMFYGGKLLSHLCVDHDALDPAFIELLKINPNAVVVCDSDRAAEDGEIRATKSRIQQECSTTGAMFWLTDGREIENYIPPRVVETVCARLGRPVSFICGLYEEFSACLDKALLAERQKPVNYGDRKVGFAREFATDFTEHDLSEPLRDRLESLATTIRSWNL